MQGEGTYGERTIIEVYPRPFFNGNKYLRISSNMCLSEENINLLPVSVKAIKENCAYFFSERYYKGLGLRMCQEESKALNLTFRPQSVLLSSEESLALHGFDDGFSIIEDSSNIINWA